LDLHEFLGLDNFARKLSKSSGNPVDHCVHMMPKKEAKKFIRNVYVNAFWVKAGFKQGKKTEIGIGIEGLNSEVTPFWHQKECVQLKLNPISVELTFCWNGAYSIYTMV